MAIRYIKRLHSSPRWNVWLGEMNGEKVVVKAPAFTISPKEIEYFRKRAKIWMEKLNKNPNTARLLSFDENNAKFIIRHYPKTLGQILEKKGRLPASVAKGIILGIANALRQAHELGIVHGDIKPENILLDETNTPKLTDWEDAILIMEEDNIVQYTPGYEAPEQRKKDPAIIDERTDIYQLGILLYEMIEGTKPETLAFTRMPEYMRPLIVKCLMENPDERYHTVDELIADLRIEKIPSTAVKPRKLELAMEIEKLEWMNFPPIERVKKLLEEIGDKPVAISIEKIAEQLGLTAQQVRAAINILAKEKGIAILEGRVITIPGVIQLALKTQKPIAEIFAGQKLPVEWWQRLLEEIEKQNIVVPFGEPTRTREIERAIKRSESVAICAGYAVPKTIREQIQKYAEGREITHQLIQDMAIAFELPLHVIQAIIEQQKVKKELEIEEELSGLAGLNILFG